jgi:hypothetical protein
VRQELNLKYYLDKLLASSFLSMNILTSTPSPNILTHDYIDKLKKGEINGHVASVGKINT